MRALILGAGGQIGRALGHCAPAGVEVFCLPRADCDITDDCQLREAIAQSRPDIVFNAAGYTDVDRAEGEAVSVHEINAVAPGRIARMLSDYGGRFVHLSTNYVFDGADATPRSPVDRTNPLSVYARSKLEGERAALRADPSTLVVRTAWVYSGNGKNFVTEMLRLMGASKTVRVVWDQLGTPTYAPSLAAALWGLASKGAQGLYHYTDAGVASWYDFAIAIKRQATATGLLMSPAEVIPVRSSEYPRAACRPAYGILECSAAWRLLGGSPRHWQENLRTSLEQVDGNG